MILNKRKYEVECKMCKSKYFEESWEENGRDYNGHCYGSYTYHSKPEVCPYCHEDVKTAYPILLKNEELERLQKIEDDKIFNKFINKYLVFAIYDIGGKEYVFVTDYSPSLGYYIFANSLIKVIRVEKFDMNKKEQYEYLKKYNIKRFSGLPITKEEVAIKLIPKLENDFLWAWNFKDTDEEDK